MRATTGAAIGFAVLVAASFLFDAPPARPKTRRADGGDTRALEAEHARLQAENAELEAELRTLEAEIGTLEAMAREEERVRAWYSAQSARASPPPGQPDEIPAAVLDAAAALHVPEGALRAAFDAARDPSDRNLARLREAGVSGFRGLVAILRECGEVRDLGAVVAASWSPEMAGEEKALIDAAEWDSDAAVAALGYCDTPRARDYLIARLRRGDAVGSCAEALGRLREPRAVPLLAREIARADAQARAAAITALGDIGGGDAASILTDCVRKADPDLLVRAVVALARVDRAAARREAASLLSGPRRGQWNEDTREALQQYAEKK